jgi:Peptidase A4 family
MFPTNAIQVVGQSVQPGDHISASVTRSGTSYTLNVTDSTTPADSFTTTQTCSASNCVDSSAEWIAEAPSGSSGLFPLTNFGTWTLTSATVKAGTKSGTISKFPDSEITMTDGSNKVKAQPGALNAQGNQFKVTWKRST